MKIVNIIGAGMAGSILAKLLRKEQIPFRIFDCKKEGRASVISENLIGTTWYTAEERKQALDILNSIVPIRFIESNTKAHQVLVNDLLEQDVINEEVRNLYEDGLETSGSIAFGINVDCRGVWADHPNVTAMTGHGLYYTHLKQDEFIVGWKPYRHAKLVHLTPRRMWFGNSLVVKLETYNKNKQKYKDELDQAAVIDFNLPIECNQYTGVEYWFGHRPKTPEQKVIENVNGYVMTGGYKSGLVAYPIMAQQLIQTLKRNHL